MVRIWPVSQVVAWVGQAQDPGGDLFRFASAAEGDAGGFVTLDFFDGALRRTGPGFRWGRGPGR